MKKHFLFLGFGYKVNVRFNFRSRQTQAGMQVSSAILFRVPLFNRVIIEKALSQITNMKHIFSAKSLKRGKLPGCSPGCGPGYPSIISECFSRISVEFPVCFLVFTAVMPLWIKTLSERILLATSQDSVVCSQLELNFLIFSDTSLLTLVFVKLLYLTKYYFFTSTMHIF